MYEHESDILVAEPEEETLEKTNDTIDSLKEDSNDLIEIFYKPQNTQENKTVKKQTESFSNYNFNHLNKVYKKYDVVKTYIPKKEEKKDKTNEFEKFVTQQDSYTPQKETFIVEKTVEKPVFRLKQKAKVWLVCFTTIIVLLSSLCIINAIDINNLNNNIEQTTSSINDINKNIQTTIKDIGKLTDEQEIKNNASDLGLTEVEPKNNIEIELNEKNIVEDYQGQTNFFDDICNFIRSLFGG